ncbi:hypothetical protein HMPREF9061_00494 [Actinomyces sp. oral taxon 181 str. F0379]|nr:hypothetical protein HMPREF9061_00494 [Actinomyces sp. oral taxon 181 str. F0379]
MGTRTDKSDRSSCKTQHIHQTNLPLEKTFTKVLIQPRSSSFKYEKR